MGAPPGSKAHRVSHPDRLAVLVALVALVVLLVHSAWASDDAYISFRTAANLVHGHGLRWNTDERVQTFTNPLWLFLFAVFYALSRNAFYTALVLGLVLSTGALVVFTRHVARTPRLALAGLALLALSKAFVDFSTSGLENPLTHLLLLVFVAAWIRLPREPGSVFRLSLLASLLLLDRLDTVWFVLPPLLVLVVQLCRRYGLEGFRHDGLRPLLFGMLPLVVWLLFATFYFGSPLPNTAYSKLGGGIPLVFRLRAGLFYVFNSLTVDPITVGVIAMAVALALTLREDTTGPLAVGLVLYVVYVIWTGGDYMSGRFLSAPFVVAVAMLGFALPADRRSAATVALAGVGLGWLGGFPTLGKTGKPTEDGNGISDARRESVGLRLIDATRFRGLPDNPLATEGRGLAGPQRVVVRDAIGLLGYFAGPNVHVVDEYGLADPLLSRLPVPDPQHEIAFRSGHIRRNIPKGYIGSLRNKKQIEDAGVRRYAREIELVTRGRLWSWRRLVAMARLDLGFDRGQLSGWTAWSDIKRIKLADLARRGGEDRHASYTYWARDLKQGVLFTDKGLRVTLPDVSHAKGWVAKLGPGTFEVTPMRGRKRLAKTRTSGGSSVSKRRIELPAAASKAGYDGLLFIRVGSHTGYDELDGLRSE